MGERGGFTVTKSFIVSRTVSACVCIMELLANYTRVAGKRSETKQFHKLEHFPWHTMHNR